MSRLKRQQQEVAVKRTFALLSFTLLAGVGFVLLILPISVRLFELFRGGSSLPQREEDTIPPQKPVLNTIPQATFSAQLVIQGFAEPGSSLSLVNNGVLVNEMITPSDAKFIFPEFQLTPGDNILYVLSMDDAKNESRSNEIRVSFDNEPPLLEIFEPPEGAVVRSAREQSVQIKGKTDPGTRLSVSNRSLIVNSSGDFSGVFQLSEGQNTLLFDAVDPAGNRTQLERIVLFEP